jgi:hypothetical protein
MKETCEIRENSKIEERLMAIRENIHTLRNKLQPILREHGVEKEKPDYNGERKSENVSSIVGKLMSHIQDEIIELREDIVDM